MDSDKSIKFADDLERDVCITFGEYFKNLREFNCLSQRDLAEKSGISATEISRIETGDGKQPLSVDLKALAPNLGVLYEELLNKAGYIEEVIDHQGFIEKVYRDKNGRLVDIVRRIKGVYENNRRSNFSVRTTGLKLSDSELNIIKAQTDDLLERFLKNKKK